MPLSISITHIKFKFNKISLKKKGKYVIIKYRVLLKIFSANCLTGFLEILYNREVYNMAIQESGENYLETILIIRERKGYVRSIDVANELKVSKPSVSRAMSVLKREGLIDMDGLNQILLTKEGENIAQTIYERHRVLTKFLASLGVDEETAAADACRIEHVISPLSFDKIKEKFFSKK